LSTKEMSTIAFILSLIGGILIIIGSGLSLALYPFGMYNYGGMMGGFWGAMRGMMSEFWGTMRGMMGGYGGMMGGGYGGYPQAATVSTGIPFGLVAGLAIVGLIAGIAIIIGSPMLKTRPTEHKTWGATILIFSIISFLGMGGFFIGAILGIAGGMLALIWKPTA